MKKSPAFEFLPHTADIKIRAYGKTLEEAFENSALALKEVMSDNTKIAQKSKQKIEIESEDKESLLYDFLEQFLYLFDAESFILSKIENLSINKSKNKMVLKAEIIGDNSKNYKFTNDVKAITYNEMSIKKHKNGFAITFVLDV